MKKLFTIGHSTRAEDEFLNLLLHYEITHVVDVRTIPKSKRYPWFKKEHLESKLLKYNIIYWHMPGLGGFRKPKANSINMYWKNEGFRGFADYMQTEDFELNLKKLNKLLIRGNRVTIMCAEALPWRCHRFLISDAEVVNKIEVVHIFTTHKTQEHKLSPYARIATETKRLTYPDLLDALD